MKLARLLIVGVVVCLMTSSTLIGVQASDTAQAKLTAWTLIDMRRADQPDIFVQDGDTLHLKEDWQAERLEYVFKWWGLAEPAFDYQIVTKAGNMYQRGNTTIKPELVTNFLHALTNLHQSQFILVGQDHTDDYPSWLIEITGVDGQRIQLFSASTGNPGSAPWNIIYNGRMYAQYDGAIADPLTALFTSPSSRPRRVVFSGAQRAGRRVRY